VFSRPHILRKTLVAGALVTGATLGAAGIASAATSSSSSSPSGSSGSSAPATGTYSAPPSGAQANPATMTHGPGETLLTGTSLQQAEAAANAAVPGATIIRAETDSSGAATYEVHMKKADGTYLTVELDSSFKAIKTISGFGPGPAGSSQPSGSQPSGASAPAGAAA
jgi:Peptidase propeptide and YPEB domain